MKAVHLTEEQIKNCLIFLNRTNLTGSEAEAMVTLKVALANAKGLKQTEDGENGTNR